MASDRDERPRRYVAEALQADRSREPEIGTERAWPAQLAPGRLTLAGALAPMPTDAAHALDTQIALANRRLVALEAAHRTGNHHASGIEAAGLRDALRIAEQAIALVRANADREGRAGALDSLRELARPVLAAAFTPSPAALREAVDGQGRAQWDREVATWHAARGHAAAAQPARTLGVTGNALAFGARTGAVPTPAVPVTAVPAPAAPATAAIQSKRSPAAQSGPWEHLFGQASTPVHKLARVQAPKGRTLLQRPEPGSAPSVAAPLPFDTLVTVVRRTTQPSAAERWCYVTAPDHGAAGFCEERYLAIDPPEPRARLHRVEDRATLGKIARDAYGEHITGGNDERLYVQGLYEANKDRAGVKLSPVELSWGETWHRKEAEEKTLEVYRGVQVLKGLSLWLPSNEFIQRLKASGAITTGSSELSKAWRAAAELADGMTEAVKYAAGFIVGLLEGAWSAIADLFQGAAEVIEAVARTLYHIVTGNPGRIRDMLMTWVDKMKSAWEHRGQIADEFLKQWNAPSGWDRGQFQGEVLGWVMMTVLIIIATAGAGAAANAGSLAARFPQAVQLLKTVDAVGDVTTYLGGAVQGLRAAGKLPAAAADLVKGKLGKAGRASNAQAGGDKIRSPDHDSAPAARGTTTRSGEGAWETSAKPGETPSPETIEHGTVRMEDHPGFDTMLKEAASKGFAIKYGNEAHVALVHVVDDSGKVLEIRRELYLITGMRYLDLEHEIGHLRQLMRFGDSPPPTKKFVRRKGKELVAKGNLASGKLTTEMNATVEYHNRLQEYVRLAERKVPSSVLKEHANELDKWRRTAETDGLGHAGSLTAWAKQFFHDIPALEARCCELGVVLVPKTRRW